MAIKDLLGYFDPALEAVFNRKAADPAKARKPLLKGIETAKRQFAAGQSNGPHRWWKLRNGVVALTVKLDGSILEINGVGTNHMPEERFAEFLEKMIEATNAGDFDAAIASRNHEGNTDVQIAPKRKSSISPEAAKARAQKAAASRAANKALAAKGG